MSISFSSLFTDSLELQFNYNNNNLFTRITTAIV
jgi:hypothetical protein